MLVHDINKDAKTQDFIYDKCSDCEDNNSHIAPVYNCDLYLTCNLLCNHIFWNKEFWKVLIKEQYDKYILIFKESSIEVYGISEAV